MKYKYESTKGQYLGEIKNSYELNKKDANKYMWHACVECNKERWARLHEGIVTQVRCLECNNKRKGRFRPGRWFTGQGYICVRVYPEDFFFPMATKNGYVKEHRLVMAKSLDRCLEPWEIVHHINGKKDDNNLENLQLLPDIKYHIVDSTMKGTMAKMIKQIKKLELENKLLKERLGVRR